MIKFFQKLKAKKGFTLVELIVVIAIIGVLAAILVPTMLGYVTSSRVTSADSTAGSFAKELDSFFTTADTNGYGMKKGDKNYAVIDITITPQASGASVWKGEIANGAVGLTDGGGIKWATACPQSLTSSSATSAANGSGAGLLTITLAALFPDIKQGYISALVVGGHCTAVIYTADAKAKTEADGDVTKYYGIAAVATSRATKETYAWDGHTAGVDKAGNIVGSNPKLTLDVTGGNAGGGNAGG